MHPLELLRPCRAALTRLRCRWWWAVGRGLARQSGFGWRTQRGFPDILARQRFHMTPRVYNTAPDLSVLSFGQTTCSEEVFENRSPGTIPASPPPPLTMTALFLQQLPADTQLFLWNPCGQKSFGIQNVSDFGKVCSTFHILGAPPWWGWRNTP